MHRMIPIRCKRRDILKIEEQRDVIIFPRRTIGSRPDLKTLYIRNFRKRLCALPFPAGAPLLTFRYFPQIET